MVVIEYCSGPCMVVNEFSVMNSCAICGDNWRQAVCECIYPGEVPHNSVVVNTCVVGQSVCWS